jgi:hypothetical protein
MAEKNNEQSANPFIQYKQSHNEQLERWGIADLDLGAQYRVWYEVHTRVHNEKITDISEQRKIADEIKKQYREYEASQIGMTEDKTSTEPEKETSTPHIPVRELPIFSENVFAKEERERSQKRVDHAVYWGFSDLDVIGQIDVNRKAEEVIRQEKILDEAEKHEVYQIIKTQYLEYKESQRRESNKESDDLTSALEARPNALENKDTSAREAESVKEQQEQSNASPFSDLLKDALENNITKPIYEEMKRLDERLRKLEKYTEE